MRCILKEGLAFYTKKDRARKETYFPENREGKTERTKKVYLKY
jgi:hypothetical protein